MSPAEVLAKHDARGIAEWKAYYELEPFGQDRQDAGAAIVAHTIATVNGAKGTTPADFLPKFEQTAPRKATGQEMLAKARAFVARYKSLAGGRK